MNIGVCLALKEKKVLLIDGDLRHASLSAFLGSPKNGLSTYLNASHEPIDNFIVNYNNSSLDVLPVGKIPPNPTELVGNGRMNAMLEELKKKYDYIIIDCPPSLSILTINAMTTADSVIVPIQCEYYALEGLSQLIHTINLIKQRLNNGIDIEGVVFTMFDSRTNLSQQVVENVRANFAYNVFDTVIPRNTRLAEAPSYGMPIIQYDPKAPGAEAYRALAKELIKNNK